MRLVLRSLLALTALALLLPGLRAQTAPDGEGSAMIAFGGAVAVAGDQVLVGEPGNQTRPGLVYVYRRSDDAWEEVGRLEASDGEWGDGFGSALAVDGERLLVGAGGAAYVFRRDGEAWREASRLRPGMDEAAPGFGSAVAISGDLALVGAPPNGPGQGGGAVHVFRRDTSGWEEVGVLEGPSGQPRSLFGASVGLEGPMAVVGLPGRNNRTGEVQVFRIAESGSSERLRTLGAPGGNQNMRFGASILFSGDRIIVGAPGFAQVGAAYVFETAPGGEGWTLSGRLMPFDGSRRHGFGSALAREGERIWVGAPGGGAAYVFLPGTEEGRWSGALRIAPVENGGGAFAATLAVGDGVAAFGMPGADYGAGQAAIFEQGSDGVWTEASRVLSEPEGLDPVAGGEVECADGEAALFSCEEVDLVSFLPVNDMGADRGVRANDVWGWTDPETGKEYALVGMTNQTAFVDVSDPENPVYVGRLPMTEGARGSTWRDMKVYQNHAFIVADGAGQHGVQVFDLTRLRDFGGEPTTFDTDVVYDRIASAHNIVMNTETGFAFVVGARSGGETCGGGLHMIDVREPTNPTFAGCFADPQTGRASTGYSHDAQCVTYHGPDEEYQGREICFGANETALSIADVTDKENPVALARAAYPDVGYSHQGWLTDDHTYFYMNDELDEIQGSVDATRTLIWDVAELEDPQLVGEFMGSTRSSDHNLYVMGDRMYQSNYQSGFRVVDISDRESPEEIGHLDTVPYGTNTPGFGGSWSNYPFFESGVIIVTSSRQGLFVVRPRDRRPVS